MILLYGKLGNKKNRNDIITKLEDKINTNLELFQMLSPACIIMLFILDKKDKVNKGGYFFQKLLSKTPSYVYNSLDILKCLHFIDIKRKGRCNTISLTKKGKDFIEGVCK